ncbi:GGDEF domain-containing protein [Deinococcus ruber]|uniref:GGDEF domain-containing protein n=1 Tax=Deinococcus ruber TaxID=1848197 RepID=A0A918CIV6_9DEIO|nr:GGDEF domain-containing protein [Deinococcus ruber]GGR26737.1 hypothetical protein GCM10008957_42760 [Deinococcus ruber]
MPSEVESRSRADSKELHLRHLYFVFGMGVASLQTFMAQDALVHHQPGLYLQALIGAVVTTVVALLTQSSLTPLPLYRWTLFALGYTWLLTSLWLVALGEVKAVTVIVGSLVMALSAFMWLPVRVATFLAAAGYALLWLPQLGAPDVPTLLAVGVVTTQLWYLSVHGRSVQTERVRSEVLAKMAFTDPLTGVLNRRSMLAHLQELAASAHTAPEQVTLVMLDLDHFKRINDEMGHHRGDEVLVAVAQCLSQQLTKTDALARWGGEEFLVALSATSPAHAHASAEALLTAVRRMSLPGFPAITMSAGMASLAEASSVRDVLVLADRRLYLAKDHGRDRLIGDERTLLQPA